MNLTPNQRKSAAALSVTASLVAGIALNEGFKGHAYADSGGVYTVGYGETKGVKKDDTTTKERALIVLGHSIDGYAIGVRDCLTAPVTQGEFNSLVDAAYNTGTKAVCKSPMIRYFNQQKYEAACLAFKGWYVHDHEGHFLNGLVNRRNKEYLLCIG